MSDKPRDIFISYRRGGGFETAHYLYEHLTRDGYGVTFDLDTLRSGRFDEALLDRIDECTDFIVVFNKGCFERTLDSAFPRENDWLRRELGHAIAKEKNVIPVLLAGFEFPAMLPDDIDAVRFMNGPKYFREYIDAFYGKLKKDFLLTVPSGAAGIAGSMANPDVMAAGLEKCGKCHRWRRLEEMFGCERCGKNFCLEHQDLETYLCRDCAEALRAEEAEGAGPEDGPALGEESQESERLFQKGLDAYEGRGVEQSDAEAAKWWRAAAERGDVRAQYTLGVF